MNFISTQRAKRSYYIALKAKQKEIKTKNGDVISVTLSATFHLERSKTIFKHFKKQIFEKTFKTIFETIHDTIYKTIF